jgi:choice-of-anchor B domain-containing protein
MSYLAGKLQANLLTGSVILAVMVTGIAWALPEGEEFSLQHEDHVEPTLITQETGQSVCQSGVSGGFACNNIEMLSRIPLEETGGNSGSDSWGWVDPGTGRYYALMAQSDRVSFIDVTVPEAPVNLGYLPASTGNKPWRDVKVYRDHAYIVADGIAGHGMQVFDLTRLRGVTSIQVFTADTWYSDIGAVHNIAINEDSGFAYLVGSSQCNGGLYMLDIRAPKNPVFAGCFSEDGYTHDVQCVTYHGHDHDYRDSEICFGANVDSLTVIDVTDKSAPVMLGRAVYPDIGYSHQGWLDEENGLFFMGDETDELNFGMNTRTLVFDVRDLDNPVFSTAHQHATPVIDHNLYVKDGYLFQANYKAGLRILKIDPGSSNLLTEVAYFDTEPEDDSLAFSGAWNVYPFFDNGTLLVSDMNNGLFVLKASLADNTDSSAPINGSISGAWVAEDLNDQGIMFFVSENASGPIIFYTWFAFLNGNPFWVTGAAPFEYGVDEISIPSQRLSGLSFAIPNGSTAIRQDIGNLDIHVHDCNSMHVNYDFGILGSRELLFTRLAGVEGRACID